ncbi:MAG: TolB family protein [Methylocella sp.]
MGATYIDPVFLMSYPQDVCDYRCVVNAQGTAVIFERWANPQRGKSASYVLYQLDLTQNGATPAPFLRGTQVPNISTRPDWSWYKGQVAFSNGKGISIVGFNGINPVLLNKTEGMSYPAWFPLAQLLAVMNNNATPAVPCPNTTKINLAGTPATALAGPGLWAGMPSVNPISPNLIAFAGQNVQEGGSYNQDQNYIWLVNTDTSLNSLNPKPLEQGAPSSGSFNPSWQGRAPWWSPDGNWVAFESNRASPPSSEHPKGQYAIFVYRPGGGNPAVQVTDPKWNMNHAKWYPNGFPGGPSGDKKMVVASYQPGSAGSPAWPWGIVSLDVASIVG